MKHIPTISEYEWYVGTRARWECSCGDSAGKYLTMDGALRAYKLHVQHCERWEATLARWAEHNLLGEA